MYFVDHTEQWPRSVMQWQRLPTQLFARPRNSRLLRRRAGRAIVPYSDVFRLCGIRRTDNRCSVFSDHGEEVVEKDVAEFGREVEER